MPVPITMLVALQPGNGRRKEQMDTGGSSCDRGDSSEICRVTVASKRLRSRFDRRSNSAKQ